MNLSLNMHEEGCTPFDQCQSCLVVAFLKRHLSSSGFETFQKRFLEFGFEPNTHKPECSPLSPCQNCQSVMQLKESLGKDNLSGKSFFEEFLALYIGSEPPEPLLLRERLNRTIDSLELPSRSENALRNDNILTIRDLVARTERELIRTPNFGQKSLNEIKEVLGSLGLKLASHS